VRCSKASAGGASANAQTVVSRAFQVLSDADKKAKYDKFGGDPDARFQPPPSGGSGFGNFARSQGGGRPGPMFEEEISPEEMFRQFFGGGGPFGGPFGMSARSQMRYQRLQAFMVKERV
jgi:DnaJ-class molecular chaperone